MIILAIDLFGIQPFLEPKRIVLKPGLNTVVGPNGSGKTMAYHVLSSLLMNTPSNRIASIENKTAQAAVTFQSKDRLIYRIARNYAKEEWHLSKMDDATKKFQTVETDKNKILEWLRTMVGGLNEKERSLLFLIERLRLPSYIFPFRANAILPLPAIVFGEQGTPPSDIESDLLLSGVQEGPAEVRSEKLETEKEQELKTLELKLEAMEEEHDSMLQMHDQASSIRNRIEQCQDLMSKIKIMEETEANHYVFFSSEGIVPKDLLRDFEEGEKEKAFALGEIEDEIALVETDLAVMNEIHKPQFKDPLLLTGLFLIVIAFLLPFVVTLSGPYRYLFLVGIFGGGALSVFAYFKRLRRMAMKRGLKKTLAKLDKEGRQIEKQFEEDHWKIFDTLQKTGSEDLSALKGIQNTYTHLITKKGKAQEEHERVLEGKATEALEADADRLDTEAKDLAEKLKGLDEISREVHRLKEEAREENSELRSSDSSFFPIPGGAPTAASESGSFFSSIFAIKKPGDFCFQREQLQENAAQVYRYFLPEARETIWVDENGAVALGETPLNHLSSGTADQVFLSLALSVLVQFSDVPFPLLLDDPFSSLDSRSKEIAGKILKQVTKKRQVIFFSNDTFSSSVVDHCFQLNGATA